MTDRPDNDQRDLSTRKFNDADQPDKATRKLDDAYATVNLSPADAAKLRDATLSDKATRKLDDAYATVNLSPAEAAKLRDAAPQSAPAPADIRPQDVEAIKDAASVAPSLDAENTYATRIIRPDEAQHDRDQAAPASAPAPADIRPRDVDAIRDAASAPPAAYTDRTQVMRPDERAEIRRPTDQPSTPPNYPPPGNYAQPAQPDYQNYQPNQAQTQAVAQQPYEQNRQTPADVYASYTQPESPRVAGNKMNLGYILIAVGLVLLIAGLLLM